MVRPFFSLVVAALTVGLACGSGSVKKEPDGIPDRTGGEGGGAGGAAGAVPDAGVTGRDATGGTGGRGGSGGSTPRDAGPQPDAGPLIGLDCNSAKFCDDFESYTAGARPAGGWTVTGSVVVDSGKAFSGTKSILIKGPGPRTNGAISRGRGVLPFATNTIYGRMMVWLTAAPAGSVHWDSIWAIGKLPATTVTAHYRYGGGFQKFLAVYGTTATPNPDCSRGSQTRFPTQRWACLQWQFDGSPDGAGGTKNEARLWMDGNPISDATVVRFGSGCISGPRTTEWKAPVFDTFQVGWRNYQDSTTPIEMWIDDVAFDEKPVSCPAVP